MRPIYRPILNEKGRSSEGNFVNHWLQAGDDYVAILSTSCFNDCGKGPCVGLSSFSLSNVLSKWVVPWHQPLKHILAWQMLNQYRDALRTPPSVDVSLDCANFNTLRPRQDGRHFPDDIFRCIFLNENTWIAINISLNFVTKGPLDNIPSLVQIMACGHYLNQWWLVYRRIYASLGLNELKWLVCELRYVCLTMSLHWLREPLLWANSHNKLWIESKWNKTIAKIIPHLFTERIIAVLNYSALTRHLDTSLDGRPASSPS